MSLPLKLEFNAPLHIITSSYPGSYKRRVQELFVLDRSKVEFMFVPVFVPLTNPMNHMVNIQYGHHIGRCASLSACIGGVGSLVSLPSVIG